MLKLFSLFIIIYASVCFAQVGFDFDYSANYMSNAFYNYKNLGDYYHNIDGYINYDWIAKNKGLRISYNVDTYFFKQYKDRDSHAHIFATSYYFTLQKKHRLNGGLDFSKRVNTETYKYYQRSQITFYNHLKYILAADIFAYIGNKTFVRQYEELDIFSYIQNNAYLRLSKFFNSGTTLILQYDYLTKKYLQNNPSSPLETLPDLITAGDGSSAQQLFTVRAAQAVGHSTGLSAQFSLRKNDQVSTRFIGSPDSYYYSDEEIFNNHFGYESAEFSIKMKRKFKKWDAAIAYARVIKNYTYRPALDLEGYALPGDPLRKDKRTSVWAMIDYKLNVISESTMLSWNILFLNNDSNDSYYHFINTFISLGIKHII